MPAWEIIALAAAAGFGAGMLGAVPIALAITRGQRSARQRDRLIDAYARWLAARMTLTRTSGSVVAAFRALAAERRDSPYLSLRHEETQRARAQWCDAMGLLDQAEAELILCNPNGSAREDLARFPRVRAEALRRAINGNEADAERLVRGLRSSDRQAIDFVQTTTARVLAGRSHGWGRLMTTARRLESILGQWSQRAGVHNAQPRPRRKHPRR